MIPAGVQASQGAMSQADREALELSAREAAARLAEAAAAAQEAEDRATDATERAAQLSGENEELKRRLEMLQDSHDLLQVRGVHPPPRCHAMCRALRGVQGWSERW